MTDNRPVYLNLFKIRLPLTGVVSLLHRVSGALLFIAIPYSVYLLDLSVTSAAGFDQALAMLEQPLSVILQLILLWALVHHFFAGIRFLLIDADIGVEKRASQVGAWMVVVVELLVLAAIIWMWWS